MATAAAVSCGGGSGGINKDNAYGDISGGCSNADSRGKGKGAVVMAVTTMW
jgi:hypothetical protein